MLFLCNIANVAQRTFEIVQKSRSREHGDIIIYYRQERERIIIHQLRAHARASPETSTCEVPCDVSRKVAADFVFDNGVVEVSLLHV